MTSTPRLNGTQLAVLRWIADGSSDGTMQGYGYRIPAAALRTRGLIKISGRSATWRARLTPTGQRALGIGSADAATVASDRGGALQPQKPGVRAARGALQPISLPQDLRGAHPLVKATSKSAVGMRPGDDGRLRIGPRRGIAHIEVSRSLLRRAMLILHGLTKEALRRGWEVVPYPEEGDGGRRGIAIKVGGHPYPVELDEPTEQLPLALEEIVAWRRRTHHVHDGRLSESPPAHLRRRRETGRLRLMLPNGYLGGRASWCDGPRGLVESKMDSIFRTLEQRAVADDLAAAERASGLRRCGVNRRRETSVPGFS